MCATDQRAEAATLLHNVFTLIHANLSLNHCLPYIIMVNGKNQIASVEGLTAGSSILTIFGFFYKPNSAQMDKIENCLLRRTFGQEPNNFASQLEAKAEELLANLPDSKLARFAQISSGIMSGQNPEVNRFKQAKKFVADKGILEYTFA